MCQRVSGSLNDLEKFQELIKNKPYRSSLAHELRFTTYRVDIILFMCCSNWVNYAYEFYEFSFECIKGKDLDQLKEHW